MEQIFAFLSELPNIVVALNAVIVALIALFVLIPGSQPEAFLQKLVDLLEKFSRK